MRDASPASPPQPVYRGAVLGLGRIALAGHLPALREDASLAARLDIVATVDASPEAVPVDGLPLLRDRQALAALEPIDFVDVCTPTATHLELTLWALARGYHVLCEKPVAVTRAAAERIAAAARRAGRVVVPCHQYRFNQAWRALRAWLDDGRIGRWHLAQFEVCRPAADAGRGGAGTPWRGRRAEGLGGVLLDHGTHIVYQILDVAGPPRAVRAWTGRVLHGDYDVEDTAQLVFEYPDRVAIVFLTWAGRRRENRIRFFGECGEIEWSGGRLTCERDGCVETRDYSAQLDKRRYAAWFAELFAQFIAAMDSGDGAAQLEDITQVAGVLEAAYAAAGGRSGARGAA